MPEESITPKPAEVPSMPVKYSSVPSYKPVGDKYKPSKGEIGLNSEVSQVYTIPINRYLEAEIEISQGIINNPENYFGVKVGTDGKVTLADKGGRELNLYQGIIGGASLKLAEITQLELKNGLKITCDLSWKVNLNGNWVIFKSTYYTPNNGPVYSVSLVPTKQLDKDLNAAAFVCSQIYSSLQQVASDPATVRALIVGGMMLAF